MGNRHYTTLETTGPNATAARQAVIDVLKAEPMDKYGFDRFYGSWVDKGKNPYHPTDVYFDKNMSGQGAVTIAGQVSHDFPEVTFKLFVDGSFAEDPQGPVIIKNGKVEDGRSWACSYGEPEDPICVNCFPSSQYSKEDLLPIDRSVPEGRVTCPKCGRLFKYTVTRQKWADGRVQEHGYAEVKDVLGWYDLYEIPRPPAMALVEKIQWHLRLYLHPLRERTIYARCRVADYYGRFRYWWRKFQLSHQPKLVK